MTLSLPIAPPPRLKQEGDYARAPGTALRGDTDGESADLALARSLTELGLIDEYRISLHPVVLGRGTPYFAAPRPPLRLMTHDRIGEDVLRLTYVIA